MNGVRQNVLNTPDCLGFKTRPDVPRQIDIRAQRFSAPLKLESHDADRDRKLLAGEAESVGKISSTQYGTASLASFAIRRCLTWI